MLAVSIMFFGDSTRLSSQPFNHIANQKTRPLIERHQRILWVIGLGVKVEQVFHPSEVFRAKLTYTPLTFEVGREVVFLRMSRA